MYPADFAAMSDPDRNRNFSRRWLPPPPNEKRRPGQGAALDLKSNIGTVTLTDRRRRPQPPLRRPA